MLTGVIQIFSTGIVHRHRPANISDHRGISVFRDVSLNLLSATLDISLLALQKFLKNSQCVARKMTFCSMPLGLDLQINVLNPLINGLLATQLSIFFYDMKMFYDLVNCL